jgi:hypothetical protein
MYSYHQRGTERRHPKPLFIVVSETENVVFPVRVRRMRLTRSARAMQKPRVLQTGGAQCLAFSS